MSGQQLRKSMQGPINGSGPAKKFGIVVQGQDEAMHFKQQLLSVLGRGEMALLNGLCNRAFQSGLPVSHHGLQRVTDCPGTVVKLHGTADVDATLFTLQRHPSHPAFEHAPQARQPPGLLQGRLKDLCAKTAVVLADHADLELLARSKMSKDTRLAHVHAVGHHPNGQTLQPFLRGQLQRGIKNGVRKVNIDTDNRMAMTGQVRKVLSENPTEFDPRKYLKPAMDAMTKLCKQRFEEFGTAGKASKFGRIHTLAEMAKLYAAGKLDPVFG